MSSMSVFYFEEYVSAVYDLRFVRERLNETAGGIKDIVKSL